MRKVNGQKPIPVAQQLNIDIKHMIQKYADKMSGMEFLACMARATGALIAMQDATAVTYEQATALVEYNINLGNTEALALLEQTEGNA